jgi:hypothetical protein
MIIKYTTFTLIFWLAIALKGYSQVYKLSPGSAFELGKGIDLRKVDEGKIFALFKKINAKWENETGTVSTSVFEQIITSEQEYQSSKGLDVNLSARYMGASLDASYKSNEKEILNSSSLTLSFVATSDFGKQVLSKVTPDDLEEEPKNLIAQGKYEEFITKYGNYFVNAIQRQAGISVYLILTSMKKESKKAISTSVTGSYSTGPGSGFSASVSLSSEVSNAIKEGRTSIKIESNGDTTGFAGLRDLLSNALKQNSPLDKIAETLRDYIGQFTRESSIISAYYLTPMTALGIPKKNISWNEATNVRIRDLYKMYKDLLITKDQYETLLNDNLFNAISKDEDKQSIKHTLDNLDAELFSLSTKKDQCLFECQENSDIYTCCSYTLHSFKPNTLFSKYWDYYNVFDHVYNYPSLLNKGDTLTLVDQSIPELNHKRIKITYKFMFGLYIPQYWWAPYLVCNFRILVNGKPFQGAFGGQGWNMGVPMITDENGIVMPDPEKLNQFLSTEPIEIVGDSLKIRLVMDNYINGSFTGATTYTPANGPIRLFPKNYIKIELVE